MTIKKLKYDKSLEEIPVTILGKWLATLDNDLTDSIAALSYMPDEASELLLEKSVAAVSLRNNIRGFTNDPHGYANVCLILTGQPSVRDYIAQVSPTLQNYAVWEMKTWREEEYAEKLVLLPDTVNYIVSTLEAQDYLLPPEHLQFLGYIFKEKYKDYIDKVEFIYDNYKTSEDAREALSSSNEFVKFHMLRLLEADSYFKEMKEKYDYWSQQKVTEWLSSTI